MNIDKVAEALAAAIWGASDPESVFWDLLSDGDRETYRDWARAAMGAVFNQVTRVELVKRVGTSCHARAEHWADSWEPSLQDDGRTLKLFAKGSGYAAECERDKALAADLSPVAE